MTYTFYYDELGRKTGVSVGSQALSTNSYTNDRWGQLSQVTYGNGATVGYEYDDYGRLKNVRYDGSDDPRYEYQYGANGQVAIVKDNQRQRTIQSEYDLAERPVQMTVRNSSGGLFYRSTLHYDGQNRLDKLKETIGSTVYNPSYEYGQPTFFIPDYARNNDLYTLGQYLTACQPQGFYFTFVSPMLL